ncbi:COA8 family protein CG14806, mitochondrial [Anabrus simplex]|uniref:COA8 family protein CG14806, mitochondrial n=1 Tax=Anabrus simplex TaxID=316456 RepID=UPI0034DD1C43
MVSFGMKIVQKVAKKPPFYRMDILLPLSIRMQSTLPKNVKRDMIGPANSISNLRQMVLHVPKDETPLETEFRLRREEVRQWNETFWTEHNREFYKKRRAFISASKEASNPTDVNTQMTADEMSIFYKKFLDEKWKTHVLYNFEWYRRNIMLLVLAFRVAVYKGLRLRPINKDV